MIESNEEIFAPHTRLFSREEARMGGNKSFYSFFHLCPSTSLLKFIKSEKRCEEALSQKKNDTQKQKTPKGKVTKTKERQINQNQTKINRGENYRKKKQRPKQKERTGKN